MVVDLGKKKKPVVKIAIPFYDHLPEQCIFWLENMFSQGMPGYDVFVVKRHSTIIQFARNELVVEPKQLDWDFLFFIDDDVGFLPQEAGERDLNNLVKPISLMKVILDHNLDICGGLYCSRGKPYPPLIFKELSAIDKNNNPIYTHYLDYPLDKLIKVDAIGTGWLCIKKRVFDKFDEEMARREKVRDNYLDWSKKNAEKLQKPLREYLNISKAEINPPFWLDLVWDESKGEYAKVGEDIYFCREAKKLGFDIWCDTRVKLGHETKIMITPDDYQRYYKDDLLKRRAEFEVERKIKYDKHRDTSKVNPG